MPLVTVGPRMAGAGADSGGSGYAWGFPGRVTAADNSWAEFLYMDDGGVPQNVYSNYLVTSSHGFSIPSNTNINGIIVEAYIQSGGGGVYDGEVRLVRNGSVTGINKARNALWGAPGIAGWGSNGDLWGTSWKPVDINSSGFGVAIRVLAQASGASGLLDAYIDWVRIYVYTIPIPNTKMMV